MELTCGSVRSDSLEILATLLVVIGTDIVARLKVRHVASVLLQATHATLVLAQDDSFVQIVKVDRGPHISTVQPVQLNVARARLEEAGLNIGSLLFDSLGGASVTFVCLR